MKITVKIAQDVPNSLYCDKQMGRCSRVEKDESGMLWCSLFEGFLDRSGTNLLKCPKCLNALREELEKQ